MTTTDKSTITGFEAETRELRIGAGWVVHELRRIYQGGDPLFKAYSPAAMTEAIRVGRICFPEPSPLTDEYLTKIASEQATLRGYSPPGVSYHEDPCDKCLGKGKLVDPASPTRMVGSCPLCEGDGFRPPMAEMPHRIQGLK